MALKTYDPKKVSVIVGGHNVQGFADGEFIMVERNSDTFTRVGGADGEQTRMKSNDKSGRFTITLLQSSLSNSFLQGIAIADETNNAGLVPVLIKDNNGTELESAEQAWIVKPSAKGRAKENSNRVWIIETGYLNLAGGGIEAA